MQIKLKYWLACMALVVISSVWFYFTPYIAAKNMKKAAESNDPVALSSYINFPLLKESLKANFSATLASEVVNNKDNNPFAALGAVLAAAMINPIIDALVTPESLAMMMNGKKPNIDNNAQNKDIPKTADHDADVSMNYQNFDTFVVSVKNRISQDAPVVFVFLREGLFSWKVSSIRLPTNIANTKHDSAEPQQVAVQLDPVDLTKYIGQHPSEIFNEPMIEKKFKILLNDNYEHFLENISVSSPLEFNNDYYLGSGCSPHSCGSDESAFAINKASGSVYAITLFEGKEFRSFGVNNVRDLPPFLYSWFKNHGGQD